MNNKLQWFSVNDSMKKITNLTFIVFLYFTAAACDGGISGTGDGGPIVITDPSGSTTGSEQSPLVNETMGSTDSMDVSAPLALSVPIPNALVNAQLRNEQVSSSEIFAKQFNLVASEISQIESQIAMNQNLAINSVNIGYFDNRIEYTNTENNVLQWSNNNSTISLTSSNTARTLYFLQEEQTITLRRLDYPGNTLFQATVISTPENTIIEATINNNGTLSYLRTITANTTLETIVFTQHPTDTNIASQREVITSEGAVTDIQMCTVAASTNSCQEQTDWSVVANSGNNNNFELFTTALSSIDAALMSLATPRNSLAENVSTAVIATTNANSPTTDQILCGLQMVNDNVRAFCLQPQPFIVEGSLFEETLSGGQVLYRALQ